ncbi:MAG: hypothetical protein SO286_00895 [Candidatus Enterosoma sp.]|nr:hypothetical protein [Candidatus Enterosoma sp.]
MYIIKHEEMTYPLMVAPVHCVAQSALEVLIPKFVSGDFDTISKVHECAKRMMATGEKIDGLWVEQNSNAWGYMRYFEKD